MHVKEKIYIDGSWVSPAGSGFLEITNPATEELIGRIPAATREDAGQAVAAARRAADAWGCTPVAGRIECLAGIHRGLAERAEEIAGIITAEVGMPLKLSRRIQAGLPVAVWESYVKLLGEYAFEERIGNSLVLREPAGVAACITPWNYPLHQVVAKVAPALAAGCTVVLKPSEVAPLSAFILAEVIHESGLPAGVFNLLTGTGAEVGEQLAQDPDVDLISFTGSLRAGRRVAELAAGTVKRVSLELGGKSAAVILDDADLPTAVKATVAACFINSGQTCTAHTRLLVPERLYQQAAELAVAAASAFAPGDPLKEQTRLGPLVSAAQRERVRDYIRRGIAEGAELMLGGAEPPDGLATGFFVRPTVFGRVTPEMTIAREEIFGPVLSIMAYRDEDEAVGIANGTIYGLAAAVWSGDPRKAESLARRLKAGQVDINGGTFNLLAPFGGFKQSGYGRELGSFGLEEFLEIKSMQFKL
ncbi:MAG: aldehyde dehydrogenase [Geobacteraceae bacterium GWC2_55_20]|nr:MAG: aldehyde dehydrogenase [Geobacteraceae bacterium GWC2_55_20]OGU25522.1 MAG: aldehyde dehydrogenase [Geobacteraceae bacterium GWF2_54_21]HBA72144.1 aldehyde dehydrogenase family protein [Geobacter sp.]HCE68062.1 aldehyde dehydrogenase family protein [Geobacter sp.]